MFITIRYHHDEKENNGPNSKEKNKKEGIKKEGDQQPITDYSS